MGKSGFRRTKAIFEMWLVTYAHLIGTIKNQQPWMTKGHNAVFQNTMMSLFIFGFTFNLLLGSK